MSDFAAVRSALRIPAHLTETVSADGIVIFVSRERFEAFSVDIPLSPRAKAKRRNYWTVCRQKLRRLPGLNLAPERAVTTEAQDLESSIQSAIATRAIEMSNLRGNKAKADAFDATKEYAAGDIVWNSWGHEQTNIDFYQIEKVTAKSVVLRKVKEDRNHNAARMTGTTTPRKNDFETNKGLCRENGIHRVGPHGVKFEFGYGAKWDGKPKEFTTYA